MGLAKSDMDLARYEVRKWYFEALVKDPDEAGLTTHANNIINVGLEMAYVGFLDSKEVQAAMGRERASG